MPLAEIFQDNHDLNARLDKRIRELRQEYYGRLIDENDDDIAILESILHVFNNPNAYDEMHANGLGNHSIVGTLKNADVLNEAEATQMVKQLKPRKPCAK